MFLKNLRKSPIETRKNIVLALTIIFGAIILIAWIVYFKNYANFNFNANANNNALGIGQNKQNDLPSLFESLKSGIKDILPTKEIHPPNNTNTPPVQLNTDNRFFSLPTE